MSSRNHRATIAAETVAITQHGSYRSPSGNFISIAPALQRTLQQTRTLTPEEFPAIRTQAQARMATRSFTTTFDVQNETTFAAAQRLVSEFGPAAVAALNFASAKNPGGGFLNGSQAQEESLARASALYASIQPQSLYYDTNRNTPSLLYTDHLILSPRVPVFRDDNDNLLEAPWEVTIITAPAPNAGAIATHRPEESARVESTLRHRMEYILATAIAHDQTALVLGAWGCGVFKNDPARVATCFADLLLNTAPYAHAFQKITFAILDRQGATLTPFKNLFKQNPQA